MTFATELDIRQEGALNDFEQAPSDALAAALRNAHEEILSGTLLSEETAVPVSVRRAEALLALSHFFRALAVSGAVSAEDIRTTGLRLDDHARIRNWLALSQHLWEQAWGLLRPYLKTAAPGSLRLVSGKDRP